MILAFFDLTVGLQAVAHLFQQEGNRSMADAKACPVKRLREMAGALGYPEEGGLRIAPGGRLEELFQLRCQAGLALREPPSPAAGATDAPPGETMVLGQFAQPSTNGRARHAGEAREVIDTAPSPGPGFGRDGQASLPLVEQG